MRIAVVHSFYSSRQPSGENVSVESEVAALRRDGHTVQLFAARTDDLETSVLYPITSALRVASGRGRSPLKALEKFAPDIVHIHNLFPNFSRQWVFDVDVPVIAALHNYRSLCANALLFRNGQRCTLCPDGRRWAGIRYGCYRHSRIATLPIAWSNRRGPHADPVLARADKVRLVSHAQLHIYKSYGLELERASVIPNFLPDELATPVNTPGVNDPEDWLYVGRLSEEKGILDVLRYWPDDVALTVIGDGPLRHDVEQAASRKRIRVLGLMSRSESVDRMRHAIGLLIPSKSDEGAPVVYMEALASGLPVAAMPDTAVHEQIKRDRTGQSLNPENLGPITFSFQSQSLRQHCRTTFEAHYSEDAFRRNFRELHNSLRHDANWPTDRKLSS